ncbi:dynein regulatory complex subunit 7 [Halichoeres trimaculatus]|uniref:dynein regulatory complex subunit 7 n=1 Tax=Halichoeres trimaculatus TaxID=147232 RepID=UPI003D9EE104
METVVESDQEESAGAGPSLEEDLRETISPPTQKNNDQLRPESYRLNSPNEIHMLKIADSFQRQYSYLFPERKPLLLSPLNECGVKKFVSTTLGLTSTSLPELYTWEGCAGFVADFLSLVPLDPPEDLPRTLSSPTWVLQSQRATSFESASLLCSLLISINYDAYCVSGFAVREMCLLDQSLQDCPLLDAPVQSVILEEQLEHRYALKPRRELRSHFLTQEEKKERDAEAALLQKQKLEESELQRQQPPADPLRGLRRHCWVLVLSGSRGVQEAFFIDPLTGKRYSTGDDNFLGVDSVWDNFNYYVNVQDCSDGCANLVYDLEDLSLWEPVLFGATSKKQLTLEPSQRKESQTRVNNSEDGEKRNPSVFDMPRSWVDDIRISKKDLEDRWPGRQKVTLYRRAKLERFAIYLRRDGLVTRLTTYKDLNWTEELRVKEWFQNRKDHLEEREINKVDGVTSERFKHGRRSHLTRHRFTDIEHELLFGTAQPDDLVRRVVSPSELKEYYEGRADLLYFRHAVFDPRADFREATEDEEWLQKVVERFHRNSSKPADQDVAERVFLLAHNQIEVTYHLDPRRVIPAKRSFVKPRKSTFERKAEEFRRDMATSFQVDPAERPLSTLALYRMMKALREDEEEVVQQVKQSRQNVIDTVTCRQREEENVELSFSPWTTMGAARWSSRRQEMERLAEEEQRWYQERKDDILAPLSKYLDQPEGLDSTKAKELYQQCLSNYRQRLVEKANILQERYDKETQELQRMQQTYQKNQLTLTEQQVEEYQNDCRNKTLQIHVTKERLKMHKVSATERYSALEKKLREDPRLGPYLEG